MLIFSIELRSIARPLTFRSFPKKHTLNRFTYNQKVNKSFIFSFDSNFVNIDGMIYFVKGSSIGSDFGFPRLAFKKKYKW